MILAPANVSFELLNSTILFTQFELTLSSTGAYLAGIDDAHNVHLFNSLNKSQIIISVLIKAISVVFSLDDAMLILPRPLGIDYMQLNSTNMTLINIEPNSAYNQIQQMQLSPDGKYLIYLNASKLSLMNATSFQRIPMLVSNQLNSAANGNCPATIFTIDRFTSTIYTANNQSKICSWRYNSQSLILENWTTILYRLIVSINVMNNSVWVTNRMKGNTIVLNKLTLQVQNSIPSKTGINPYVEVVQLRDYVLSYARSNNHLNIYNANSNLRSSIALTLPDQHYILSAVMNYFANEIYLALMVNLRFISISVYQMQFNCSQVSGSISSGQIAAATCPCAIGKVFNQEKLTCQVLTCPNNTFQNGDSCHCPLGQSFDRYTLKCGLDCRQVAHAIQTLPYANPPQCLCISPAQWVGQNTCFAESPIDPLPKPIAIINCTNIAHAIATVSFSECLCHQLFGWSFQTLTCNPLNVQPVQPVVPIIPVTPIDPVDSNPNNYLPALITFLVILLIFGFLALAAFCIFKMKARKNSQQVEEKHQNEQNEIGPSDRQLDPRIEPAIITKLQSAQDLQTKTQQKSSKSSDIKQSNSLQKKQIEEVMQDFQIGADGLVNFPDEDDATKEQDIFTELQSNLDQPFT